ncbi:MAG: hypothetical protein K2X47_14880 [Bdellovibrionales bacterium]|nr:hypothetical protein [Bdellovibrionales bacterium]
MVKGLQFFVIFGVLAITSTSGAQTGVPQSAPIPEGIEAHEKEAFLKFRKLCPYVEELVDLNSPSLVLRAPVRDSSSDVQAFFNSTQGSWNPIWMSPGALQRLNLLNTYGTKNRRPEDAQPPYSLIQAKIKHPRANKTAATGQSFLIEIMNRSFKSYYGTGKATLWALSLEPDQNNAWGSGYIEDTTRGETRVIDSSPTTLTLLSRSSGNSSTGGEHPSSFFYNQIGTLMTLEREAPDLITITEANCVFAQDQFRSSYHRVRFSYSLDSPFQIRLRKAKK